LLAPAIEDRWNWWFRGSGTECGSGFFGGKWVRFQRVASGFILFGLGLENGFVWQFRPQGFEPFELLDRAAVVAFRLGLMAQDQGPTVGLARHAVESFAQRVVAVLGASDFDIPITGQFFVHQDHGVSGGVERLVEAGGEETGLKARGAEESLLGEARRPRAMRSRAKSSWELTGW